MPPRKRKPADDNVIRPPQFKGPSDDAQEGAKAASDDAKPKKKGRQVRVTHRPGVRQQELWDPNFDFSTLDDEELARGRRRDSNGGWSGRPPTALPAAFHRKAIQELFNRANTNLRANLVDCVDELTKIATNPNIDPAVRARTAQWVIERVMGKTPDVVEIKAADPWDAALEGVIAEAEDDQIRKANHILNKEVNEHVGD